jgi:NADH dehydrogenase FAD-containing subunit
MTAPQEETQEGQPGDPRLDVVVVGGGQSGLAMAWHLANRACGSWSWRPPLSSATSGGPGGTR